MESEIEKIFWKDKFGGKCAGGYFFRNDLRDHIKRLEEETGQEVVGIVYDGTYNLEFVISIPEEAN